MLLFYWAVLFRFDILTLNSTQVDLVAARTKDGSVVIICARSHLESCAQWPDNGQAAVWLALVFAALPDQRARQSVSVWCVVHSTRRLSII